ncbi:hypothetical protein ACMFMG_007126 [Clarireedia jacksonii]
MFMCGMRVILGRLRFLVPRGKLEKAVNSSHRFLEFHIDNALTSMSMEEKMRSSLLEGLADWTEDTVGVFNQMFQNLVAANRYDLNLSQKSYIPFVSAPRYLDSVEGRSSWCSGGSPYCRVFECPWSLDCYAPGSVYSEKCLFATALRLYPVFLSWAVCLPLMLPSQ